MTDAHDLHVLNDLAAAVRATDGAPEAAASELEAQAQALGGGSPPGGLSVVEAAREALTGLTGRGAPAPAGTGEGGTVQRLASLLARFEAAMADDRLSGPSRDAVIRAFDPVKAARDAALQQAAGRSV